MRTGNWGIVGTKDGTYLGNHEEAEHFVVRSLAEMLARSTKLASSVQIYSSIENS